MTDCNWCLHLFVWERELSLYYCFLSWREKSGWNIFEIDFWYFLTIVVRLFIYILFFLNMISIRGWRELLRYLKKRIIDRKKKIFIATRIQRANWPSHDGIITLNPRDTYLSVIVINDQSRGARLNRWLARVIRLHQQEFNRIVSSLRLRGMNSKRSY